MGTFPGTFDGVGTSYSSGLHMACKQWRLAPELLGSATIVSIEIWQTLEYDISDPYDGRNSASTLLET
jgi:hypothetical protein